ncbi:NPAS4 family protein [Megaselia abdita]
MLANSWLYHYYSVQTKIQFGLPFEGSSRITTTTPTYYHQTPNISSDLAHTYSNSHHVPYGYHAPVGLPNVNVHHQSSPSAHLISHHPSQNGNFTYKYDQPVDYSQNPLSPSGSHQIDIRCSSTHSSSSSSAPSQSNLSSCRVNSPPIMRKRIMGKLKPLFIFDHTNKSPEAVADIEAQCGRNEAGSVIYETVLPTRPRILTKAPPSDPPELIDTWIPSPPWSEGTQKVPDLSSNVELSPAYMVTTTPPTPNSAPSIQNISGASAFSFDWISVGEQFVPIIDSCGMSCLTSESLPVPVMQIHHHWPPDHRIISLHASSKNTTNPNEATAKKIRREGNKKDMLKSIET